MIAFETLCIIPLIGLSEVSFVPRSAALVKVHIVFDDIVLHVYADLKDRKSIFMTVPVKKREQNSYPLHIKRC